MKRRLFLASTATALWKGLLPRPALGAQSAKAASAGARRTTAVTPMLKKVSRQRREMFFRNPDGKSAIELNAEIPEIDPIEVLNTASDAPARNELRVVAWNLERGRHWRDGAKLIREHPALKDPDVLLLSEMDLGMARSSNEHTTREMAAALEMNYAYGVEVLELTKGEMTEKVSITQQAV